LTGVVVKATDLDTGVNALISYSIHDSLALAYFQVHTHTSRYIILYIIDHKSLYNNNNIINAYAMNNRTHAFLNHSLVRQ